MEKQVITAGEVPVSPFSRLFSLQGFDCFNIVTIGFKNEANPSALTEGFKNTLTNHPRFSSILVINTQTQVHMRLYIYIYKKKSSYEILYIYYGNDIRVRL